jgi:hypothetical protein
MIQAGGEKQLRAASLRWLLGVMNAATTAFGQNVLTVAGSPTGHSYLLAA